ncbi:MAG: Ig-like domain-containing protein [Planctomycetaceae bacterium]
MTARCRYTSGNADVASVTPHGLVRVHAAGLAKIVVTDALGAESSVNVTGLPPPSRENTQI